MQDSSMDTNFLQVRMQRLFTEGFIVLDISEALISFDAERDAAEVKRFMSEKNLAIIGVRKDGVVAGYAKKDALTGGKCADHREAPSGRFLAAGSVEGEVEKSRGNPPRTAKKKSRCKTDRLFAAI
jgi:hypothetical protein